MVPGCTREQSALTDTGSLSLDHSAVTGLGDFIEALGDVSVEPPLGNDTDPKAALGGCACQPAGGATSNGASALAALGLLLAAGYGRRRRRG